jgi:hypothetical protein
MLVDDTDTSCTRDNSNTIAMKDWEAFRRWIDLACSNVKWMAAILDPAYLLIRDGTGAAPPAAAIVALGHILVGPITRSAELSVAPTLVVPPGGRPGIPGLYQFSDSDEAGLARVGLTMWATSQAPQVNLDIMRFATTQLGLEWL